MSTSDNSPTKTKTCSESWRHFKNRNFCFCKGVLFASGLAFSDKLIDYSILSLLITYITEDYKSTAILVMIQDGLSTFLQIFMNYISYTIFSRIQVIIVSSFLYISGLLLFFLEIIKIFPLNVIGILLLAVGQAGVQPLIREFVFDQYRNHEPADKKNQNMGRVRARENAWYRGIQGFSALVAFLTFSYAGHPRRTALMVSIVATGSSSILFLLGTRIYHTEDLGDRADTCRRRFVSSLLNPKVLRDKLFSRCNRDSIPDKSKHKKWKRWWTIFLLFGLVLSGGITFFPYQGQFTNYSNYLSSLVIMKSISRGIISYLFEILPSKNADQRKKIQLVRIGVGILTCIPCFLVARWIELRRLNSTAEMSIFWLVPEFCMLGLVEGLAKNGLDEFMIDLSSGSRKEFMIDLFSGLGNFANILLFLAYLLWWNHWSATGGDVYLLRRYFLILTIISSVILIIYSVMAIWHYKTKNTPETSQTAENSKLDCVKREEEDPERSQTDNLDLVNMEGKDLERPTEGGLGDNAAGNEERSQEGGGSEANTGRRRDEDNDLGVLEIFS